jgi:hypothetical protein
MNPPGFFGHKNGVILALGSQFPPSISASTHGSIVLACLLITHLKDSSAQRSKLGG